MPAGTETSSPFWAELMAVWTAPTEALAAGMTVAEVLILASTPKIKSTVKFCTMRIAVFEICCDVVSGKLLFFAESCTVLSICSLVVFRQHPYFSTVHARIKNLFSTNFNKRNHKKFWHSESVAVALAIVAGLQDALRDSNRDRLSFTHAFVEASSISACPEPLQRAPGQGRIGFQDSPKR